MKKVWEKIFGFLQSLSKAIVIPISLLPGSAILLGLSFWLKDIPNVSNFLYFAGQSLFNILPYLFVASIAYGLSKEKDWLIVLIAIISYQTIISASTIIPKNSNINIDHQATAIFIGIFVSVIYNFFKKVKIKGAFSFFEGKKFASISTIILSTIIAWPMAYLWHYVILFLKNVGLFISKNKPISSFFFGTISRLLIPSGLHHNWHNLFWFDTLGISDMSNYLLGYNGGTYLTGYYPIMLFALPAAALAIIHTAKKEKKKSVTVLMTSAILSSILLGITEPIEFSFLFVAPLLFLFHAIATGVSMLIMNLLNVTIGFSFSAGLVDLLINYKNPLNNNIFYIIPIGIIYGVIYYFVFKFFILKFNIKTPGRSKDDKTKSVSNDTRKEIAEKLLEGLGGRDNIINLDHCSTRLRLIVDDTSLINEEFLKNNGALSILKANNNIQIVIGPEVEGLVKHMNTNNDIIISKFKYPIKGIVKDVSETPDEVFSKKLIGPGFVIFPEDGNVYSPIDGTIKMIYPSKHAIAISSPKGFDVMIHFGIETVKLKGEGFNLFVELDQEVKMGDLLMKADIKFLEENAESIATPVVFVQKENFEIINENDDFINVKIK